MKRMLLIISLPFLLGSCLSNGRLSIEKSEQHDVEVLKIKKIVTIDPDFFFLDYRKTEGDIYLDSDQRELAFNKALLANAEKCGIQLIIADADELKQTDLLYFNQLIPLKNQLLNANFTQTPANEQEKIKRTARKKSRLPKNTYLKYAPQMGAEFSALSKKYGTPYFAAHGFINLTAPARIRWGQLILLPPLGLYNSLKPRRENFYFLIVANIETGETLYREYRSYRQATNTAALNTILYDSFRILKENRSIDE